MALKSMTVAKLQKLRVKVHVAINKKIVAR
jgi:hypothetical protein